MIIGGNSTLHLLSNSESMTSKVCSIPENSQSDAIAHLLDGMRERYFYFCLNNGALLQFLTSDGARQTGLKSIRR